MDVMHDYMEENEDVFLSTPPSKTRRHYNFDRAKYYTCKFFQLIHFIIVMVYLWAGLVEFIRSPPYFDGYGDAAIHNRLPDQLFQDNPWNNQTSTLRLMDLPLLGILLAYAGVSSWLTFQGLSWLLTLCVTIVFLEFLTVNYWAKSFFDWRYYHKRLSGLELQISSLAFTVTMILMVLFYKRRRLPFKFKSSLPVKHLGILHLVYNFISIMLITFTCMLLWFTKMYISWACFRNHQDLMKLCQITAQVQCYPCDVCTYDGLSECYKHERKNLYSCNMRIPEGKVQGSFCLFNYNMSSLKFLTIFAYIGGLCVFLSTLLKIGGHYLLRLLFKIYETILLCFNKSSETIRLHKERVSIANMLRRKTRERLFSQDGIQPLTSHMISHDANELEENDSLSSLMPISEIFQGLEGYDDDGFGDAGFCDASCG